MTATIAAPAPVRKPQPVRKPKPAPRNAELPPALSLVRPADRLPDTPATAAEVRLYRAWAGAIRSLQSAKGDLYALAGIVVDDFHSRPAAARGEAAGTFEEAEELSQRVLAVHGVLGLALDLVFDGRLPDEVEFLLGRLDRPVPGSGKIDPRDEFIRKARRKRCVKRFGKHARPAAPLGS